MDVKVQRPMFTNRSMSSSVISYVAKACLFTAVFSQLSIFTADCLRHPIQMAGVETIWELHTLSVIYS